MPIDKSKYPANWKAISKRIRAEARWMCEECGAPDRQYILRSTVDASRYVIVNDDETCYTPGGDLVQQGELPTEYDGSEMTFVILTVHHKGVPKPDGTPGDRGDKMDCRDENLAALCQRCHLLADMDIHVRNRKRTVNDKKRQRKLDAGQKELW